MRRRHNACALDRPRRRRYGRGCGGGLSARPSVAAVHVFWDAWLGNDASGARVRWTGGHASFFVPVDARAIELPLRTTFDHPGDWPITVSVAIDDRLSRSDRARECAVASGGAGHAAARDAAGSTHRHPCGSHTRRQSGRRAGRSRHSALTDERCEGRTAFDRIRPAAVQRPNLKRQRAHESKTLGAGLVEGPAGIDARSGSHHRCEQRGRADRTGFIVDSHHISSRCRVPQSPDLFGARPGALAFAAFHHVANDTVLLELNELIHAAKGGRIIGRDQGSTRRQTCRSVLGRPRGPRSSTRRGHRWQQSAWT